MPSKIDTVTSRDTLKARHAPYWQKIRTECHIGYRKTTSDSSGAWIARYRDTSGKYQLHSLGSLESFLLSRRYDEAVKQAVEWFDHRKTGGISESITLANACERYIEKLQSGGKVDGAIDVAGRFKRWVFSDPKLSKTALLKLTPAMLNDWRVKLATTPALLQNKSKTATKLRAASTVNRNMAVLKAALNLAREDGYTNSDHAWRSKLKPIKNAENRRDCYLDIEQRRRLILNSPADLAALIKLMSLIPLRPGAVASLTVGNFEHRLGVLTVGAISPMIEHGQMKAIQGIIVHQTGGTSAKSSLESYKKPNANGAHFLIDKDGTIYQTASVCKITYHVGPLKSRCELEGSCSLDEQKLNKIWNVKAQHQREMQKSVPTRYPSNSDAIGIELVGEAVLPKGGTKNRDETYVAVTEKQNESLQWLVSGLVDALKFSKNEIFTHPTVSRKLGSEASTAKW